MNKMVKEAGVRTEGISHQERPPDRDNMLPVPLMARVISIHRGAGSRRTRKACKNCTIKKRRCDGDGIKPCRHCAQRMEDCMYSLKRPSLTNLSSANSGMPKLSRRLNYIPQVSGREEPEAGRASVQMSDLSGDSKVCSVTCCSSVSPVANTDSKYQHVQTSAKGPVLHASQIDSHSASPVIQATSKVEACLNYQPRPSVPCTEGAFRGVQAEATNSAARFSAGLIDEAILDMPELVPPYPKLDRGLGMGKGLWAPALPKLPLETNSDRNAEVKDASKLEAILLSEDDDGGKDEQFTGFNVLPRKTPFSPSVASGLPGMMEGKFLETFFTHFVTFLPVTTPVIVQQALSYLMDDTGSSSEISGVRSYSNANGEHGGCGNIRESDIERRGDIMYVVGHSKHRGNSCMATMWQAVALGAVLQGCGKNVIERYVHLARHCLQSKANSCVEDVQAHLLGACIEDALGHPDKFRAKTNEAIGVLQGFPSAEQDSMHPVLTWFKSLVFFSRQEPVLEELDVDTTISGVTELCKPLARELEQGRVTQFIQNLDLLCIVNALEMRKNPASEDRLKQQAQPILKALRILSHRIGATDVNGRVNPGCSRMSALGALVGINVLKWFSYMSLVVGLRKEALELSLRVADYYEQVPGILRLNAWMHRCEFHAFQLAQLGSKEGYERVRHLYNDHAENSHHRLPALDKLRPSRDCCHQFICRQGLKRIGFLTEEEAQECNSLPWEKDCHIGGGPSPSLMQSVVKGDIFSGTGSASETCCGTASGLGTGRLGAEMDDWLGNGDFGPVQSLIPCMGACSSPFHLGNCEADMDSSKEENFYVHPSVFNSDAFHLELFN